MRLAPTASLLLTCACATLPPFRAADPAQVVPQEPYAASSVVSGVRVTARPGWRGSPPDLKDSLAPVEVSIENGSGRALQVHPSLFGLLAPDGFSYTALDPRTVRHLLASYAGGPGWYFGFYGAYPWPGFYGPWLSFYPYGRWGPWGPYGYGYDAYPPPPRAVATEGTLASGGRVSLLLFFPVPASSLPSLTVEVKLVDSSGAPVGDARIPFVREGQVPPQPRPTPPAPGPAQPAPPPAPQPSPPTSPPAAPAPGRP